MGHSLWISKRGLIRKDAFMKLTCNTVAKT